MANEKFWKLNKLDKAIDDSWKKRFN